MTQENEMLPTALKRGMTQASQTSNKMELAYLKNQGTEFEKFSDIACTLMARDYKGLGNQRGNGVIEYNE